MFEPPSGPGVSLALLLLSPLLLRVVRVVVNDVVGSRPIRSLDFSRAASCLFPFIALRAGLKPTCLISPDAKS